MFPTRENVAERSGLDIALVRVDGAADIYVLYPSDATDEEAETMWIRCAESDLVRVADRR